MSTVSSKKIVVINGHPSETSFNHSLVQAYLEAAIKLGIQTELIEIGQLNFDPNLKFGYEKE